LTGLRQKVCTRFVAGVLLASSIFESRYFTR